MSRRWVTCLLLVNVAILITLAFALPALAQTCGGFVPSGTCGGIDPCACGESVIANRTIGGDPVLKGFCPGTALFMNTPGVTVIFKKKPLAGSPNRYEQWSPGDGICINADNITIQKGRIEGFRRGIFGTTNGSRILGVNAEDNAVNGINITGNNNTFDGSAGSQSLGPDAGDGMRITGNDNVLTDCYSEKSPPGAVAIRVTGDGNFLQDNFVEQNQGGGILVTGGDNIDGGGNKAKKTSGTPKCEIDGDPCMP